MLKAVRTGAVLGVEAEEVVVEAHIGRGLPSFTIVGLPDAAVRESRDRVRAAIINSEYEFPPRKLTVNLAPANIKKEGPAFDLPLALAVLKAMKQADDPDQYKDYWVVGELSLTGTVSPVRAVLSIASAAARAGSPGIFVPCANAGEAAVVDNLEVIPISHLAELVDLLAGRISIDRARAPKRSRRTVSGATDFKEIKGQLLAKRAMEIAAAGSHNVLLIGPPGSGKSMLARGLPSLLPELSLAEAIETTKIYSVAGESPASSGLMWGRPFRSPHHSISAAGMAGGGQNIRPGEISLSHRGVLFLDEMPQFGSSQLQVLRQPLESGEITIARASGTVTFPARFMLVAAMNPCPCGYRGDRRRECTCALGEVRAYQARLSGPLIDRIDMIVEVPRLAREELGEESPGESSDSVKQRVVGARALQERRFNDSLCSNAKMSPIQTHTYCRLTKQIKLWYLAAADKMSLSARGYDRALKVARTIADLAGHDRVEQVDIAEAIQYQVGVLR